MPPYQAALGGFLKECPVAVRPRDERGWRVRRPGTISAVIYALARQGLSTGEIAKELGRGYQTVAVLVFKIKHPERGNQLGNARREKRPSADNGQQARFRKEMARILPLLPLA